VAGNNIDHEEHPGEAKGREHVNAVDKMEASFFGQADKEIKEKVVADGFAGEGGVFGGKIGTQGKRTDERQMSGKITP
jgi:hypothetical protein